VQPIHLTTNFWLVALFVLSSIISSYAAFSFADRIATARGVSFFFWLSSGAGAIGLGIWSMHYLGMLVKDINQQKLAQAKLDEADNRSRMATRAGAVGVWDYDIAKDRLRKCNAV
jgi:PAS domain-containing protein